MMFIVRSDGAPPEAAGIAVKLTRSAPPHRPEDAGKTDFFCLGEEAAIASLRAAGWQVVLLHDGYYEDGRGGGVAIWGQGRYWEIRDTPLTVKEKAGPSSAQDRAAGNSELVEVRRAIFGA
jgi:hypothetical protein